MCITECNEQIKFNIASGSNKFGPAMLHQKLNKNIHLGLSLSTVSFLSAKILAFLSFQMIQHIAAGSEVLGNFPHC